MRQGQSGAHYLAWGPFDMCNVENAEKTPQVLKLALSSAGACGCSTLHSSCSAPSYAAGTPQGYEVLQGLSPPRLFMNTESHVHHLSSPTAVATLAQGALRINSKQLCPPSHQAQQEATAIN
ncbi:unnamed protein product [Pleuronectes platessa]|uniref:Uncharacterized protein n=1 Tax=Pleuronectes platessa TaxID=8262 RepID=A0A9N7VNF1_PLEPL|nr:unnamed protein product [Pleuronectes platessa]